MKYRCYDHLVMRIGLRLLDMAQVEVVHLLPARLLAPLIAGTSGRALGPNASGHAQITAFV